MKISILLPFKENYSKSKAGAVSLFVKDILNKSKFKKDTIIYGSTDNTDYLSSNYINLPNNKKFFKSSNNEYVKSFIADKNFYKTTLLEIHNRPNYVNLIKSYFKKNIFLYFHNDPLYMNGSRELNDREYLINNVDKILFNSQWSKDRFFIGFKNFKKYIHKVAVCYQSTNKVKINFEKKEKIISFIGKLNSAKGYDIFGEAIQKILDKNPDWKSYVIGDEPREKINIYHKNLINLGFKDNNFILNFLKKVSISVVPSRWDEPFGRSSLESASRGSAVIISQNGGLPETTKYAIILKPLNAKSLYNEISRLIKNKKYLLKCQKDNYENFYLTHSYVAKLIDNLRMDYYPKNVYLNLKKKIKIIHITNFNYRFDGRLQYNTGRRINNGLVRLGHNVLTISDRDIVSQNKKLTDLTGESRLQDKIINSYHNFKPDLVILGHADAVNENTLEFLKEKKVKISQWFLDPIAKLGPDYSNNKKRLRVKEKYVDTTFLTTDPKSIDFNLANSFYIPNPCDVSFETLSNYNNNCQNDLFFAMSHGVHRGALKIGKFDKRETFINKLIKKNPNIVFDIYGMNEIQPIWGENFINNIANSSMGLNLSRGEPIKYYSSDRIAQLMGNGLLTFIDEKTQFGNFFSNKEIVLYKNIGDLSDKLNMFKKENHLRKLIAKNGKKKYFKYFNSTLVADFIVKKTFQKKTNFFWEKF